MAGAITVTTVSDPAERLAQIRRSRTEAAERWVGFPGLIRRTDLDPSGGLVETGEYPELGAAVEAVIVGLPEEAGQIEPTAV
jgi:hypothetical protein